MSLKIKLYSFIGYLILKFFFWSNKKEDKGFRNLEEIISLKRPIIICSWHGRLLFPIFKLNKYKFYALAGLHTDAEIISNISMQIGWKMIRGSSKRGGSKAYKNILKKLNLKETVFITPDGPTGPEYKIKEGIIKASIKTEALIIPVSGIASKKWVVRNWDTFIIPKPLGKILNICGKIIDTKKINDPEKLKKEITKELNKIEQKTNEWKDKNR